MFSTIRNSDAFSKPAAIAVLSLLSASLAFGQTPATLGSNAAQPSAEWTALSASELEELVGPIALYPDDLVGILLPASTYPLQIVQASRYLEERADDSSLEPDPAWDDSIVALLNYPEALALLNDDLDWTWSLGEAVVYQQGDVLNAIQTFRDRAYAAGNLATDDRQVVATDDDGEITIAPADPEVIYVPYYDPARVVVRQYVPVYHYYPYGYPLYYYPYPAGYSFRTGFFWGVTTAFLVSWHDPFLHVFHPSYYGHPYYGYHYYTPWYTRTNVYVNVTNYGNHHYWNPGYRYGGSPRYRVGTTYAGRYDRNERRIRTTRVGDRRLDGTAGSRFGRVAADGAVRTRDGRIGSSDPARGRANARGSSFGRVGENGAERRVRDRRIIENSGAGNTAARGQSSRRVIDGDAVQRARRGIPDAGRGIDGSANMNRGAGRADTSRRPLNSDGRVTRRVEGGSALGRTARQSRGNPIVTPNGARSSTRTTRIAPSGGMSARSSRSFAGESRVAPQRSTPSTFGRVAPTPRSAPTPRAPAQSRSTRGREQPTSWAGSRAAPSSASNGLGRAANAARGGGRASGPGAAPRAHGGGRAQTGARGQRRR